MRGERRTNPILGRARYRAWLAKIWMTRSVGSTIPRPRMAQIEVTNRCNLACRTCTRLKLPQLGDMAFEDFCRIVDSLGRVRPVWLSGQGEPLLHRDLPRMVRYCTERGIRETILHTNGMLLHGEMAEALAASGLGEMRISIDGGTATEMEYLRTGASFQRILENTRAFAAKGTVRTAFYTVLNRRNQVSVALLPELAASLGVPRIYMAETVPFRDESTEREIYDRREYQFGALPGDLRKATIAQIQSEAVRHGIDVHIDLKWYRKRCFDPFHRIYIDFQGNVTPCCRIHNEFFVGNILTDGLAGSWHNGAMTQWRRDLLHPQRHRRICVERCNLGIGAHRYHDP